MDTPFPPQAPATFGFVVLPGFAPATLAAAVEVLVATNEILGAPTYAVATLSPAGGPVATLGGLQVGSAALAAAPALAAVFVVAAAPLHEGDPSAAPLSAWLQARAAEGALMGGLDAGAACLADAGLLRGHRAAIHWPHVAALAERHVDTVVSHHCYEIDRGRLSAAGRLACQDLLIAWFGLRHGDRVAQELVGTLGLERLRPPDERQRVPTSARLGGGSAKLAEAVALMEANLGEPLPTEDIARLVGVSRRQLERLFKQHLDALPSRWYLELRLNRARRLLQHTSQSILQIGLACGFASGPHFSNAYRAHFDHTPRDERSRRAQAWRTAPTNTPLPTP
jgi:transcriptional regulator GlxA family with amidase domain